MLKVDISIFSNNG